MSRVRRLSSEEPTTAIGVRSSCESRSAIRSRYTLYSARRSTAVAKLRDRSPISSPSRLARKPRCTRPRASIACSASSRNRRSRPESREAKTNSVPAPSTNTTSVTVSSCSNTRLRSVSTLLVVSSATTAPITSVPLQIGCAAPSTTARPSGVGRQREIGTPDSAASTSFPPESRSSGIASSKSSGGRSRSSAQIGRRSVVCTQLQALAGLGLRWGLLAEAAGDGEQAALLVDHEDARARAAQAGEDQLDFLRRRARRRAAARAVVLGAELEEAWPVVKRGRDRAGGGDHTLLLGRAQHVLHLAHVAVADERDRREDERDEHDLRADRQPRAGRFGRRCDFGRDRDIRLEGQRGGLPPDHRRSAKRIPSGSPCRTRCRSRRTPRRPPGTCGGCA